ncbi:MAG: RNA polymerase sigma factor RpoH [Micavibrio sp.]|nr:MAG: RNA polymerase sigma factor RpoH [Micavibrio sp.]
MAEDSNAELARFHENYSWCLKVPMLVPEEEKELWRNIKSAAAKEKVVLAYSRVPFSLAKSHRGCGLPLDDLFSEGQIGLLRATEKYQYERNVPFGGYAKTWVESCIGKHIQENVSHLKIGLIARERYLYSNLSSLREYVRARLHQNTKTQNLGVTAYEIDEMIVEYINATTKHKVSMEDIRVIDSKFGSAGLALDRPAKEDSEEPWVDFIENGNSNQEQLLEEDQQLRLHREFLAKARLQLSDRELAILDERILWDRLSTFKKEITLKDLGKRFSITQERVRQIEANMILKLQEMAVTYESGSLLEGNGVELHAALPGPSVP